jgi:hypothetical protein
MLILPFFIPFIGRRSCKRKSISSGAYRLPFERAEGAGAEADTGFAAPIQEKEEHAAKSKHVATVLLMFHPMVSTIYIVDNSQDFLKAV